MSRTEHEQAHRLQATLAISRPKGTAASLPQLPARFRLLRELGRGGMAVVYHAHDTVAGRDVALKFILGSQDADAVKRFRREATDLAAVYHRHIVDFYSVGESQGLEFIEMEYVGGGTLRGYADSCRSLGQLLRVFAQVCSGLEHIHQRGMVHRDIKPANILMTPDGQAKIGDLGLARRASSRSDITEMGTVMGTAAYLAPEQIMSHSVGPAADLYALGVTMFEAVTGQHPFAAAQSPLALIRAHLEQAPPVASSLLSGLPARLDSLLSWCLRKDPLQRPASASELRQELELCIGELQAREDRLTASSPPAILERAKRHVEAEQPEEALSLLARIPSAGLEPVCMAEMLLTRASALEMQRDEAAVSAALEATRVCRELSHPALGVALLTLGKAFFQAGEPLRGLAALQEAREAIPSSDVERQIELMELLARVHESGGIPGAPPQQAERYREIAAGLRQRRRGGAYQVVFAEPRPETKANSRRWDLLVLAASAFLTLGLVAFAPQRSLVVATASPTPSARDLDAEAAAIRAELAANTPGIRKSSSTRPSKPVAEVREPHPIRRLQPPAPPRRRVVATPAPEVLAPAPEVLAPAPAAPRPKRVRVAAPLRLPQPDYKLAAPRQPERPQLPPAEILDEQTVAEVMSQLKPGETRVFRVRLPAHPTDGRPQYRVRPLPKQPGLERMSRLGMHPYQGEMGL